MSDQNKPAATLHHKYSNELAKMLNESVVKFMEEKNFANEFKDWANTISAGMTIALIKNICATIKAYGLSKDDLDYSIDRCTDIMKDLAPKIMDDLNNDIPSPM